MIRATRPRRRSAPHCGRWSWLRACITALLVLGLAARGHALQALGLAFDCEHPAEGQWTGATAHHAADHDAAGHASAGHAAAHHAAPDSHGDEAQRGDPDPPASHGDPDDGDCPPNCHRCPCGQIPMTAPVLPVLPVALLDFHDVPEALPAQVHGRSPERRLFRPPRRPLAKNA